MILILAGPLQDLNGSILVVGQNFADSNQEPVDPLVTLLDMIRNVSVGDVQFKPV